MPLWDYTQHPWGGDGATYDWGLGENVTVTDRGGGGSAGYDFNRPGGAGAGGNWQSGGPDYTRGSYVPDPKEVPQIPDQKGSIEITDNDTRSWWEKTLQWIKNNLHFEAGSAGLGKLLEALAKGYTGYELYKAVTGDPDKPADTPGGGGKGGGKGGGGGGGGGKYALPATLPQYQGLNYQPSFLAWQPDNAGAPVFTSGGPASVFGSPAPTPPPVNKKKKKAGA